MLTIIGLCGAGRESLTLCALELLRRERVVARTLSNDVVTWLTSADGGVVIYRALDDEFPVPTSARDAGAIAEQVLSLARDEDIVYLTPGHSVLGDRATTAIYCAARLEDLSLRVISLDRSWARPTASDFGSLVEVMGMLRDPVNGCPWDREQTHATLRRYIVEEAYEVVEAIDSGNPEKLREELGDYMLQAVFHAQLAREAGQFEIGDSIEAIVEKLIRRHPHVFGEVSVDGAEQVLTNWEKIKRAERGYEDRKSVLDGIPKDLPALMRALEVSKRVVKVGFEWPTVLEVLDKVSEEISELRVEIEAGDKKRAEAELGDLLFTLVNVARQLKIDPEDALREMTYRFGARFRRIEDHAAALGVLVDQLSLAEMESVWQAAKQLDRQSAERKPIP